MDSLKTFNKTTKFLISYGKAREVVKDTKPLHKLEVLVLKWHLSFFYGLVLVEMLLCHTDTLSSAIQRGHTSAAEGQTIAVMTTSTFSSTKNDKHFDLFREKVKIMAMECDVEEPELLNSKNGPNLKKKVHRLSLI